MEIERAGVARVRREAQTLVQARVRQRRELGRERVIDRAALRREDGPAIREHRDEAGARFVKVRSISIRPAKNETLRTSTRSPETVAVIPLGRNAFHGWNGSLIAQPSPA